MIRSIVAVAATAMLSACAMSPADQARQDAAASREEARLAEALEGFEPTGRTSSCVPRFDVRQTKLYDGAILFERSRNHVYRSDVGPGCGRSQDDILVFKSVNGSAYCSGDIVQLRARTGGFFSGTCSLGEFTELKRDPR
ncbi:hypothetical protein [Sphingomonas sp. AX6]|uniref:hypothetical protein n=1 Tax=Sphingomonas sp. AX6 TaxID=2653171 RepID=UPI0012F39058|nr:hypothetical protein [Sphingomonas sp. AX6]VXC40361.1 conserved exported hypothetical protein [Sphingomonas sp. AX6]